MYFPPEAVASETERQTRLNAGVTISVAPSTCTASSTTRVSVAAAVPLTPFTTTLSECDAAVRPVIVRATPNVLVAE